MVQAAIAHAQFESIQPFTAGNGRVGRALVNAVLRRRGVTTTVVVPLASALVARREAYFVVRTRYREGDPEPIIAAFARASSLAAQESRATAARVAEFSLGWRDAVGRARSDSAAARLLAVLPAMPVFSAAEIEQVGGATSALYRAVEQLVEAEMLRPLTDRKRGHLTHSLDLTGSVFNRSGSNAHIG